MRQVSPDERLVAWAEDRKGNESYFLRVRDIAAGTDLLAQPVAVRIRWWRSGPLPDCSEGLVGRPVVLPCPDHSLWHGPHETAACCGSNMPFPLQKPCLFVFYLGVAQPSSLSKQREQGGQMVSYFMTLQPG